VSTPNRFAALDCNVLLRLEAGDDECLSTIDGLGKIGYFCIVTETTLQELADLCSDPDADVSGHAKNTLVQINNWGFLTPSLTSIQMGVAERVAHDLISKLILHGSLNDGLVLAEAAYNMCKLFITTREQILSVNRNSIHLSLTSFDLCGVLVVSPPEMAKALTVIQQSSHPAT
jgi:hypothetical protein